MHCLLCRQPRHCIAVQETQESVSPAANNAIYSNHRALTSAQDEEIESQRILLATDGDVSSQIHDGSDAFIPSQNGYYVKVIAQGVTNETIKNMMPVLPHDEIQQQNYSRQNGTSSSVNYKLQYPDTKFHRVAKQCAEDIEMSHGKNGDEDIVVEEHQNIGEQSFGNSRYVGNGVKCAWQAATFHNYNNSQSVPSCSFHIENQC